MRNLVLIAALVLGIGACGKKDKSEKSDLEKDIADAEGFRDKMCACRDKGDAAAKKDCAAEVMKELEAWLETALKGKGGSKDQVKRLRKAKNETRACHKDAVGGRVGSGAPPDDDDHDAGAELSKFMREEKDEVCACKDMKCATDVSAKYAEKAKAAGMKPLPPTDEDMKNVNEMKDCMQKLSAAGEGKAAGHEKPEKKEGGGW
jgi:hypothetical protein